MPRIGGFLPRLSLETVQSMHDSNPVRDSLRALMLLVLFAVTFFAVMLSTILRRQLAAHLYLISIFSCMGAGVFLGACLLDLMPDTLETFEKSGMEVDFPIAEASIAVGFLMVLSLEQFAIFYQEKRNPMGLDLHGGHEGDGQQLLDRETLEHEGEAPQSLPALIMIFALSLHSLFEGLSLAVIPEATKLLQIFAALFLHKTMIGLSVGIRLVATPLRPIIIALCAFIFSVQVLIGGLGGIWLNHLFSGPTGTLVAACLQGIATGTFLFITTMEVLPHELGHSADNRLIRLLFVFIGIALVIGLMLALPEGA